MPQGLEVFNPDGTFRSSVSDNLTRVLGSTTVSTPGTQSYTMAWPFPAVPPNKRFCTTVSNRPVAPSEVSNAYAFYERATGLVRYSQGEDLAPITILFMSY